MKPSALSEIIAKRRPPPKAAPEKQLFKGFLVGGSFHTKKGYQGKRLDSLWCRQMIESFETDDEEVVKVALESVIADKHALVSGGEYGSPFTIGGYGLYAATQFEKQFDFLKGIEHTNAVGIHYLSKDEWEIVDDGLRRIARYGNNKFNKLCRGDTYMALVRVIFANISQMYRVPFTTRYLGCEEEGISRCCCVAK